MAKCWVSNNDNKSDNTEPVGRKDLGSCFRLGGWHGPSEEEGFNWEPKPEKGPPCEGVRVRLQRGPGGQTSGAHALREKERPERLELQ